MSRLVFFGGAAGAILQVMIEVTALITRRSGTSHLLHPAVTAGLATGLIAMYATALLV